MAESINETINKDLEILIPTFMDCTCTEIKELENALKLGKLDDASRMGHNIKGSALNYGFLKLAEIGRQIEISGAENDAPRLYHLLEELKDYVERVEVIFE